MATPSIHPPSPVYLGPPFRQSGDGNKPIDRLVIHETQSPCVKGQARATAAYFRSRSANGSAHYTIDPDEVIQAAYDSLVCWHAPPNPRSLGFELCGYSTTNPAVAAAKWAKREERRALRRLARVVARAALAYGVPVRFLTAEQLRAGERGITTHANVSAAFHQSSHWDPGLWPRRRFMRLVRKYAAELEKGSTR